MQKIHTETVDYKIKTCWQVISRMYNTEAIKYGGTVSTGYFLLNIDSAKGSYASDIAPLLGMESTSLSRIIKTLETEKMIVRKSDKKDKRKVKLILTKKGKKTKEFAKQIVRNFNQKIEQKIGKENVLVFLKTLTDISDLADQQHQVLKKS